MMVLPKAEPSNVPIRFAVLVDNDRVPQYVNTLLNELSIRADLELAAVIVHRQHRSSGLPGKERFFTRRPSSPVFLDRMVTQCALFFITSVEFLMLRLRNRASRPLRPESLEFSSASVLRITPLLADDETQCMYSPSDIDLIAGLALDFLVVESEWDPAFAARASMARFGAIRMRFGELPSAPIKQAGFREVCRRNPSSKFRIVLLHRLGDTDIFEGAFQTRLSMVDNRNELIRKAYPYLGQAMAAHFAQPAIRKPTDFVSAEAPQKNSMDSLLSTRELFGSLLARVDMIRLGALNAVLGKKQCWRISWYHGCWQEVGTAKSNVVENPKGGFLADPFVVKRGGRHVCFVEEYNFQKGRGVISALEFTGTTTRMLGNIIEEPFHLSFPYLFEFESQLYLCPESAEGKQIRVYECLDYPLQWRLCSVLMDHVSAVDTMLFEHDGRWWMSTNIDPQGSDDYESRMYLFWSDSPLSTVWRPHPQNPVVFDPLFARNAGFVTRDGELFRCAQRQGFANYGEGFSIQKIVGLTTEHYEEQPHLAIAPERYGARGTHHLHHDDMFVVRDECHTMRPAGPSLGRS